MYVTPTGPSSPSHRAESPLQFHSDDEPGLGPVVAGLSLGGYAEMLFRYHIACKKNMVYKNGAFKPSEVRTFDEANERVLQITLSHVRLKAWILSANLTQDTLGRSFDHGWGRYSETVRTCGVCSRQ